MSQSPWAKPLTGSRTQEPYRLEMYVSLKKYLKWSWTIILHHELWGWVIWVVAGIPKANVGGGSPDTTYVAPGHNFQKLQLCSLSKCWNSTTCKWHIRTIAFYNKDNAEVLSFRAAQESVAKTNSAVSVLHSVVTVHLRLVTACNTTGYRTSAIVLRQFKATVVVTFGFH